VREVVNKVVRTCVNNVMRLHIRRVGGTFPGTR
jgi:hypothetical protein